MKVINVQQFKSEQYRNYRERRTSQFMRFLDKSVDFVTYYSINKAISTASYINGEIDSYIGTDSPVRYNKIYNLPVYGFPVINDEITYDEDNGGFNVENFAGDIIMLPEVIEPCEGDCFILNVFDENVYFQVTEVTQISLKSRPHYKVSFRIGTSTYLPQLNTQVAEEYNAIFDNIGTADKVVVSSTEYEIRAQLASIYKEIVDYYIATYFNKKITMFNIKVQNDDSELITYTDKFLVKFMESNRIVVMDSLLKSSLILDYNALYDNNDYLEYKKSLFWAIENKDMRNMLAANYIKVKKLYSPFSLLIGESNMKYYTSDEYLVSVPTNDDNYIAYNYATILEKWRNKDISVNETVYSKVLSIIINYLKGVILMPGYFTNILGNMSALEEYTMLPILLFIIRDEIKGISSSSITL